MAKVSTGYKSRGKTKTPASGMKGVGGRRSAPAKPKPRDKGTRMTRGK